MTNERERARFERKLALFLFKSRMNCENEVSK